MLELDGWQTPPMLAALAERSWQVLHRRPPLLADLPDNIRALADGGAVQWQRYWRDNPVNAWVGGNLRNAERAAAASFHVLDDRFRCRFEVEAGRSKFSAPWFKSWSTTGWPAMSCGVQPMRRHRT
ncbi:hypothetical protein ACVBEH_20470 [Roseateles sp. GG27B]